MLTLYLKIFCMCVAGVRGWVIGVFNPWYKIFFMTFSVINILTEAWYSTKHISKVFTTSAELLHSLALHTLTLCILRLLCQAMRPENLDTNLCVLASVFMSFN